MRINVYTEELPRFMLYNHGVSAPLVEIVAAKYISSRTGEVMTNYGLRIYLMSAPELHLVRNPDGSIRDDDRSAVTFWCGDKEKNIFKFLKNISEHAYAGTLKTWHDKTVEQQSAAEAQIERLEKGEEKMVIRELPDSRTEPCPRCGSIRLDEPKGILCSDPWHRDRTVTSVSMPDRMVPRYKPEE